MAAIDRHVVCGQSSRNKVPAGETDELGLADGQKYRVKAASVKLIGTDLQMLKLNSSDYIFQSWQPSPSI